jgi:tRNA dimethylallyltransferase
MPSLKKEKRSSLKSHVGSKPPLILIVGATGVGKTEVAIKLAERLNGEIISADSRLFYRGMDIGTAKPLPKEQARIPHHLIDVADPGETLSLAVFQHMAREIIRDLQTRGKLPLLVGGTGQYLRAITEGWSPPVVKPDERLRLELGRLKDKRGEEWLYGKLKLLDPLAAEKIDPRNVRRTVRALEVIFTTGQKFSAQRRHSETTHDVITVGLTRPRSELYARIDARIESMFEMGLLDEVKALLARGYSEELPSMSAIGYRECIRVIKGEWSAEQAKAEMRRATRMFIRQQANWFKTTDPDIHWFEAGDPEITNRIAAFILSKSSEGTHPA